MRKKWVGNGTKEINFPPGCARTKKMMADFLHQIYNVFTSCIVYPLRALSSCLPPAFVQFASQVVPYVFLGSICYGLDVIFLFVQDQSYYHRALADNSAHGAIAFVSWCVVSRIRTRKDVMDAILCGLIACSIDVDHFIAAKSLRLQVRQLMVP